MSTAKRSRQRQSDAQPATQLPASKRIKTSTASHVPAQSGLGFLVNEDARGGKKLEARLTNGTSSKRTNRVDESHAVVPPDTGAVVEDTITAKPEEVIDISSAEESSEYEDSDNEQTQPNGKVAIEKPLTNGHVSKPSEDVGNESSEVSDVEEDDQAVAGAEDVDMTDGERVTEHQEPEPIEGIQEHEEPSFGEMLQARHPEPIDLRNLTDPMIGSGAIIPITGDVSVGIPTGNSVSTVLTQALKNHDKDRLELCFQTSDIESVKLTIRRLQSHLAGTLLQRLAERIHKRPGRTGNLMVWVQWSLICHGGYLATQPDVMRQLRTLSRVIRERASGLQPLLQLKGKLEMLSAQLDMRKKTQADSRAANADEEDDEEGVVYVEGQEDDDFSDDEEMADDMDVETKLLESPSRKLKAQQATPRTDESDFSDVSESGDGELANGVAHSSDDESEVADEEERGEGMLDIVAEETSNDEDEEASSAEEADSDPESASELDNDGSEGESDEAEIKQPKPNTLNRKR